MESEVDREHGRWWGDYLVRKPYHDVSEVRLKVEMKAFDPRSRTARQITKVHAEPCYQCRAGDSGQSVSGRVRSHAGLTYFRASSTT